jgi:hypothetical protein
MGGVGVRCGRADLVGAAPGLRPIHLLEPLLAVLEEGRHLLHCRRDQLLLIVVISEARQERLAGQRLKLRDCRSTPTPLVTARETDGRRKWVGDAASEHRTCAAQLAQRRVGGRGGERALLILICDMSRFMSSTIVTHTGGTLYMRASTVLPSSSLCAASKFLWILNSLSSLLVRGPRLCVRRLSR